MNRFRINGKYGYCPNGNYWNEVSGIFDTEIYLFCDCNKCNGQVYKLKAFNVTKKIDKNTIKRFRDNIALDEIRSKVTLDNMKGVDELIRLAIKK